MHEIDHEVQAAAQAITQFVALGIDLIAMVVIAYSAVRAFILLWPTLRHGQSIRNIRSIRFSLGQSLVLALEFSIGADILRTSIAPTWNIIGQLAAIVLLRTLLDYLLSHEILNIDGAKKLE